MSIINNKLIQAVNRGNFSSVQKLLVQGADANAKNKAGVPVLILATTKCDEKIVELLLEKGADANT
ncbi:MAG TPA: ankyrin repeat domain-containing protein, partial [Candidatus Sumerlaeota bacterium]|nr:ankyrin repeat domain-containing protein [Candidatus Sumerlaeota bacterium]HOR64411.1 ankyrin repeat domain-containing protein [Candidatus Sumerlaeota bacterium]